MKSTYDKNVKGQPITVGDHVMLWAPYTQNGLSRCFQPKWMGPWIVYSFTGPSNCKLLNEKGEYKNVHINQLKLIEQRNNHLLPPNKQISNTIDNTNTSNTINEKTVTNEIEDITEPFDLFDETVTEHRQDIIPVHDIPHNIINEAWVDIDANNILPHRTRGGVHSVTEVNKRPVTTVDIPY